MLRKRLIILSIIIFAILLWSGTSDAQMYNPNRLPFSVMLRGGCLLPDDEIWHDIYEDKREFIFGFDAAWMPHRTVSIGLGASYMQDEGEVVSAAGTKSDTNFQFFPFELNLLYHLNYMEYQWVVPYLGGGVNYSLLRESIGDNDDTEWQRGYQLIGGIRVPIDWLDKKAAGNLSLSFGVRQVYFAFEARSYALDDFGKSDLDFSGLAYYSGFFFEFD